MKLIIAGGSGYIGQSFLRLASESGHQLILLSRKYHEDLSKYGKQIDINDSSALKNLSADALINVAGKAHAECMMTELDIANRQLPVRLSQHVLDESVGRMVHLSSLGVYGNWSLEPITEHSTTTPATPYALSKLNADIELAGLFSRRDGRLTIIRPPMVYGTACPGNFTRLCNLVASGLPLPFGSAHARRSFIHVNNLADFLLRCATASHASGLFVIGDGSDYSTAELIDEIASARGKRTINAPVPISWLRALARASGMSRTMDSLTRPMKVDWSHAHDAAGWSPPIARSDAMRLALRKYRSNIRHE